MWGAGRGAFVTGSTSAAELRQSLRQSGSRDGAATHYCTRVPPGLLFALKNVDSGATGTIPYGAAGITPNGW